MKLIRWLLFFLKKFSSHASFQELLVKRWDRKVISLKLFCNFKSEKKIQYFRNSNLVQDEIIFTHQDLNLISGDRKIIYHSSKLEPFLWFYHQDIKYLIDILKSISIKTQIGNKEEEQRVLIWLQTSFRVLEAALKECQNKSDLVFSGFIFFDLKDENKKIFRFVAFNLDCTLEFLQNDTLHVVVYNDKNKDHGDSQKPALEAIVLELKPDIFNEFIKILNLIGALLEKEVAHI